MSHTATVQTQISNKEIAKKTCEELGFEFLDVKQVSLYQSEHRNLSCEFAFKPKGWSYPVAVKADGSALYDNYNGHWGEQKHFDEFRQKYAENVALDHAQRHGYRVIHRGLSQDGSIQLRLGR
jgi:hypothetical protein